MSWVAAGAAGASIVGGLIGGRGKKPKASVVTKDTLTPEQKAALNQILTTEGNGEAQQFEGDISTKPIPLQNLSLSAMEERVKQLATGGSDLEKGMNDQLLNIISSGGTETGGQTFEDFFKTNVEDPLTQDFQDRFAQIGTRFGGNSLFGSDRATADARGKEDFLDSIVGSRANLAFQERTQSQDNLFKAMGVASDNKGKDTGELASLLDASFKERGFQLEDINNRFKQFITNQTLRQQKLDNLLAAIRTPAIENIAMVSGGSSGMGGSLIQAGGSILSSLISSGAFAGSKSTMTPTAKPQDDPSFHFPTKNK